MRISTVTIFSQSVSSMHQQQGGFIKVGQQIASGRRVVVPSDDPQAASQAVNVSQSKALTEQYAEARVGARNSLSQAESILGSVSSAITSAKTLVVQGVNGTLADPDREAVASELKGIRETILGQANASDGNGVYLFGGYRDDSRPFVENAAGGVDYVGDNNSRQQRIDASRLMDVSENGRTIFMSVHSSAGYLGRAGEDNAGSLTFKGPQVIDSGHADFGKGFTIEFIDNAGQLEYHITSPDDPAVLYQGNYTPGEPIQFGGLSVQMDGTPVVGPPSDIVTVAPAADMNPDLLAALDSAIAVLSAPAQTPEARAHVTNTLNTVMRELDNALDNVLTVRASMGARLNELDTVDTVGDQRILNYEQTLSDLVDLDYVSAIADYTRRQIGLQAAQRTFVDLSGLSLFNFLK